MQMIAFPKDTRTILAQLELEYERGELTEQEHAEQHDRAIEEARTLLRLDETWRTDPTAPAHEYTYFPAKNLEIVTKEITSDPVTGKEIVRRVVKPDAMPLRARPSRHTLVFWKP